MYTPKLFTELKSYSYSKAISDLFAGLTVGIIALPLAMAFAIASNLPPERGIFTAIVAGFLISAFGGSKVQIGGPTGAFVVIVSAISAQYGYSGLAICTLIAGIFLILFGLCKLGGLIKFVPFPVITGFTTGIAIVIFLSQIPSLLGIKIANNSHGLIESAKSYLKGLLHFNSQEAVIGIAAIVIILLLQRKKPKLPAMLIGLSIVTIAAYFAGLNIETIGSRFGSLPSVLPKPSLPHIDFSQIIFLLKPALTIAILAAIESLLSATVADGMIGGRHRPNAELIGQGIANIGSVIFGGLPATGAIARTATNVKCGAKTPVAGIVHALTIALSLLLLAPVAKLIPISALAGILIVVSYNMSEIHHFISIFKGDKSEALVLVITCLTTVLVDLTVAVEIGIVLSFFLFVRRMSEVANVTSITKTIRDEETEDLHPIDTKIVPNGVEVFEVSGPFFFGMIDVFKNATKALEQSTKVIIIRTRNVLVIDSTGVHVLGELINQFHKSNTQVIISGIHKKVFNTLKQAGIVDKLSKDNFCKDIYASIERSKKFIS